MHMYPIIIQVQVPPSLGGLSLLCSPHMIKRDNTMRERGEWRDPLHLPTYKPSSDPPLFAICINHFPSPHCYITSAEIDRSISMHA